MKHWKITVKLITEPLPVVTEVDGDYELEDIRQDFNTESNDVEWFTIEETKGGNDENKTDVHSDAD
jgi:hypothetical protein